MESCYHDNFSCALAVVEASCFGVVAEVPSSPHRARDSPAPCRRLFASIPALFSQRRAALPATEGRRKCMCTCVFLDLLQYQQIWPCVSASNLDKYT